jgi:hypothetical protein
MAIPRKTVARFPGLAVLGLTLIGLTLPSRPARPA